MVFTVKNSLLKLSINFIIFPIYIYGSLFSFMSVLNAKRTNNFLLNKKKFFSFTVFDFANHFEYRISKDTEGPISPFSQGTSYIFQIIDAFSQLVVVNPASHISSKYVMQSPLHHWSFKFGPSQYIVPDRTTENMNQEKAQFCCLQYYSLSTYSLLPLHKWFSRSLKL